MSSAIGSVDLIVLVVAVGSSIALGLYLSGRNTSVEAYLLGDRSLPWWAILGSIVATETSTATVLSVPGEGYGPTGMRFLQMAMGYICGRWIVVQWLLPLYFRGTLSSAYQVLGIRFGEQTKRTASLIFLVARNLGDGLRLYLAASVLQILVGWPLPLSALVVGVVTIVYTYFGGMRSVVWNDCIQFVIYMLGGVASIFVIVANIPGGWSALWEFCEANNKLQVLDFDWNAKYSFWGGVFGGAFLTIGTHGTDQMMVQRYLSARSQRDAGRALLASGFVVLAQFALFLFIGVELAAYYSQANLADMPEKADQVFAHFIIHVFPKNTGLVGLMLAAIMAAAMSTLSSSLNSSASAVINDFIIPIRQRAQRELRPDALLALTRYLAVGFGLLQILIGMSAQNFGDTVVSNALKIAGFSAGLILGLFALGVLTRRVGQLASLVGCAGGFVLLMLAQFVAPRFDWVISVPWLALTGAVSTFCIGYLASWIVPAEPQTQETR
ncbi:MAG: sodium:solute symporter [Planctomycetales bacterium]|nr:sodium:solute symporter [Planctomycetales bacterium]